MKSNINFLSWQSQNIEDLDWNNINNSLQGNGFCAIQHIQSERETLLSVTDHPKGATHVRPKGATGNAVFGLQTG